MSIAPAKSASMAEGPALKLVHWIFTLDPIALSNQPLALPIIGCACVMLGNAPTRIIVWPESEPENPATMMITHSDQEQVPRCARNDIAELRIFAPRTPMDHHRQNAEIGRAHV